MYSSRFSSHQVSKMVVAALVAGSLVVSGCERLRSQTEQEHISQAKDFQVQGKLESAVIEFKNALQKNPNDAEVRRLLGELYVAEGQGAQAEKELKHAQELGANPESLKVPLGKALLQQGQYARVLAEIQQSPNSSQANTTRILELQGRAQLGMRKLEQGCALFEQALQRDSGYVPTYWGLARCAVARGKLDDARAELNSALKLEEKNSETWTLLGDLERNANRLAEAQGAYTKALEHKPTNVDALLGRAMARIFDNQLAEAGQDIDAASKIANGQLLLTHIQGILQYRQGKFADAKASFETVLKANPEYMPSVLWLGLTELAQNDYERALKQFTQFTRSSPGAIQVQALRALVQARLGGKQEAAEILKPLRGIKVDDPKSLALLGQAYMMVGENDLGIQYLSQVVEKAPEVAESRVALAAALTKKGDSAGAIEELEKALQLNPGATQVDELLIEAQIKEKKLKLTDQYYN